MRLTAKERILLHLLECGRSAEEAEVTPDLAQEGVARGAGIELRHLAQFVRPLIQDGLVRERHAHVVGIRQRRKVYALTPSGRSTALRLRQNVTAQPIRIRDGDAVRQGSIHEVLQGVGGARLLETVRQVQEAGVLDLESVRHPPEPGLVEQLQDAPQVTTFVGRREELAAITHEDGGPRVFVVRGIAGIGKSTLAAKACQLVRGKRNLFWHRIRPWETDSMVLASLGRFLDALDRPGLSSVLRRGDVRLAAEVLRQDLPDTRAFLVLDDAHDASPPTLDAIRMVSEAVASAPDVKFLVLTRRALPFYDVRDIAIRGVVREIELGGLRPEESAALLAEAGDTAGLAGLGRHLGGHPLLIELVRRQRSDLPAAIRDVHRFIAESVYSGLSESERTTMKGASLFRVPVPRATLLAIPGASYEALMALQERSLLRSVGGERYEIHDTIRDFFGEVLTRDESAAFGRLAVAELRGLAAQASQSGDYLLGIDCLSNAVRIATESAQKADLLEGMGDVEARMGDPAATVMSYREAIRLTSAPEPRTRLHRKTASILQECGEGVPAEAEVEEALRSLGGRRDVEAGWLSLIQSRMSIGRERWHEGRKQAEAALRAFRSFGDSRGHVEALVELATIETNAPEGRPEDARRRLGDALRICDAVGDPALLARIHVQFANLDAYRLGDTEGAMEHLARIEDLPGAHVDVRSRQSLLLLKGWLNLDLRGEFDEARANFEDALALARKTHDRTTAASARFGAAVAVYHAGDCASARGEIEAVGMEFLELGSAGSAVEALGMAAEMSLIMGDATGYRRISDRVKAPDLAVGLEARPVLAQALKGLDSLARGDRPGVHAAFREAIQDAEREVSPQERPLSPFAHDLYAAVLWAMGERKASADQSRLAIEACQRFGLNGRLKARGKFMDGLYRALTELFRSSLIAAS